MGTILTANQQETIKERDCEIKITPAPQWLLDTR